MFSLHDRPSRLCDGLSRRELLRVGGLSALGLSLPGILAAAGNAPPDARLAGTFGRAKNVLFLWLQGGPPQHETFDPKPDAPAEIRGEFKPIRTNVPGVHVCELLPRTAAVADKLAIVRSLSTHTDLHDASGYWILTGHRYAGRESRQISPSDWPYLGSVLRQVKPSERLPAFTSVWLPDLMRLNDNVTPAGQTAGFLGKRWEPQRLIGDPSSPEFRLEGLALPPEVPPLRLEGRLRLRDQVERHFDRVEKAGVLDDYDYQFKEAFGLLTSGKAREAFDLDKEPARLRDRYGRHKWGQCLLLGRRLIEAGARLVHVNWPREGGDEAVTNPMWDTHAQNADRLQDVLCPLFDVGFTTLIDDLDRRGLLSETLVVAIGEFGRTPRINRHGGRDHWGHVFSFALAGAGIAGGQVYGASDKIGAYPRDGKLEPQDLTATIVHLLGVGHHASFVDALGRPMHITEGEPIAAVLGTRPATSERVPPTGELALVPEYSKDQVLNGGFEADAPLGLAGSGKRLKGWLATPLADAARGPGWGAALVEGEMALPRTGKQHAVLGYGLTGPASAGAIAPKARVLLTQEVRNPRAGTFTVSLSACGGGREADYREFLKHFTCRLVLFGYGDLSKDPTKGWREFAGLPLRPPFADRPEGYERFTLSQRLRSQDDGATEIEMGVGLAVVVEKVTPGELAVPAGARAFVRVDDVEFTFVPRPRNDDVTV
jgi:hypothetical protein